MRDNDLVLFLTIVPGELVEMLYDDTIDDPQTFMSTVLRKGWWLRVRSIQYAFSIRDFEMLSDCKPLAHK